MSDLEAYKFKKPEVLAPAGDRERFDSVIRFGADAVYVGLNRFGMRNSAENFTPEELANAVEFAHKNNVKVYTVLNVMPKDKDIKALSELLSEVKNIPIDAFIITDPGVFMLCKEICPNISIHISTQSGIINSRTANFWVQMGAERIVLARELSLEEIKEIRSNTPETLEIECFVHGAMCMSFSGRCLISDYLTGRRANDGKCAQPCRWKYSVVEKTRPNEDFPMLQNEEGTYIFNSKDLNMIEHIAELYYAGVSSFKIEGRAKSAYYSAVITSAYKNAVNEFMKNPSKEFETPKWIVDETKKISYRRYDTGFYYDKPIDDAKIAYEGGYIRHCEFVGIVEKCENGYIYCEQRNKFFKGDTLDILVPKSKNFELKAEEIFDINKNPIESTPIACMKFLIKSDLVLPYGTLLRKQLNG
ncbi:MAG: peptidase U32 family protein [Candidatus Fimenecus sp.]